jgi:ParB family chromosome partitioning protein
MIEKKEEGAMAFLFVENLTGEELLEDREDGQAGALGAGVVKRIPIGRILPNPAQPRRHFEREALLSLAESIRAHGILQPPVVRKLEGEHYELIAGERRLRAASLAGMEEIPCLVRESEEGESAALALLENLQREDLDMFEEAGAIQVLGERYGLTQAEIGARLSVSQSYVANKLRLLRLSEAAREILREGNLTERHARAVLRLPEEGRIAALTHMAKNALNVAAAEAYVERLLLSEKAGERPGEKKRGRGIIKDIRLFYNSLDRAVNLVKEAGIGVISERTEREDCIELRIRIEKPRG